MRTSLQLLLGSVVCVVSFVLFKCYSGTEHTQVPTTPLWSVQSRSGDIAMLLNDMTGTMYSVEGSPTTMLTAESSANALVRIDCADIAELLTIVANSPCRGRAILGTQSGGFTACLGCWDIKDSGSVWRLLDASGRIAVVRSSQMATMPFVSAWLPKSAPACVVIPEQSQLAVGIRRTCIDLGIATRGAREHFEIIIDNLGPLPFMIRSVETSCGCIEIEKATEQIALNPRETRSVRGSLAMGDSLSIRQAVRLNIASDNAAEFHIDVQVLASSLYMGQTIPRTIDLGTLVVGDESRITCRVSDSEWNAFDVEDAVIACSGGLECGDCEIERCAESGDARQWLVSCDVRCVALEAAPSANLVISTTSTHLPHFHVPISWRTRADVTLSPSILGFGIVKSGDKREAVVRVSCPNADAMSIVSVPRDCEVSVVVRDRACAELVVRQSFSAKGSYSEAIEVAIPKDDATSHGNRI